MGYNSGRNDADPYTRVCLFFRYLTATGFCMEGGGRHCDCKELTGERERSSECMTDR